MNRAEIENKISGVINRYLIKDYHITVKPRDVILWLPDRCKEEPYEDLSDKVHEVLNDRFRITVIYPNNGKPVSEFIKENWEEIKRMRLI